ncbi:UNVERIFIED_CONTAM: hypothetical protein FKN15_049657 [Acipenser sinensis]
MSGQAPQAPKKWAQVAAGEAAAPFKNMTRRHGVRCLIRDTLSIEAMVKAMAKVVGPSTIVAASKMYGKAVFFLKSEAATHTAIERGLAVGGMYVPIEPLEGLGSRVVLSNVPPFLKDDLLKPHLQALGELKTGIHPIPLGCKDQPLRHVLSFRRQVTIHLAGRDAVEGSFVVPFEGTNYVIFYSSEEVRCYHCKELGHQKKRCPKLLKSAKTTAPAPHPSGSTSPPGPSKRPTDGGKKVPAPLPVTPGGGKGEKAPEVAGPSAPPESARGEKATEWTTVARHKKKAAARSTRAAEKGATKPSAVPSGGGAGGVPGKETPSTAPPAKQGGKAARKTKHLLPTEGEERGAAGGELPVAVAGQGTASGSIRGKRKAQARLPTCARKCTRLGLLVGVPGGAKEGPPKPKRPPRRPPSAGNEGPGPRAATEGGKDPSPEAVQGSAEEAEPMEEAPTEKQKGREESARAEIALRADPLPVSKETPEAGPDSTTEGPAAAGVAEGAQEGPPKEQLPRAPPSSDGDTGPEPCVAEEGAAEPAPEAEAGSSEPMQATSAEGPEGEEELPLPEQELPRAPEASVGSADNAEPMQETPAEGPEGGKEPPQEQEPPRAPEASVGSADNAEPMQETPAEGPEGGKEPPLPEQELPRAPEAGVGSADNAEPMHPLRQMRALRSPRLHWSPERGREGKNQRGQKVVPSR